MAPGITDGTIHERPVEILRRLIQFDTTNPPGNEAACVDYVRGLLTSAGIESTVVARDPERPNLIARLRGQGNAPTLMLYGHVDVVTTAGQQWRRPPFSGEMVDGEVWGRGALDMKSGVAMMLAAVLRAQAEGTPLPGDVLLAVLSDEEGGGDYGAKFLVEEHPDLFSGVRYALGEFGGFTMQIGPARFYPIQVAEKQICWLRATVNGPAGHGALAHGGGAMQRLGQVLTDFYAARWPVHVTPVAARFIEALAGALPAPTGPALRGLLDPSQTDALVAQFGPLGTIFHPLLHHTVNPTIVRGGDKINVLPSEITLELDGRLLPGYGPDDLLAELRPVIGDDVEVEVVRFDPCPAEPDMGLFDALAGILTEMDPGGVPVPFLLPAVTDGRFFARLGIQTYGFTPMRLPPDLSFVQLIHAADERIPADAVEFGAEAMFRALQRFGEPTA